MSKPLTVPKPKPPTVWLTRDSDVEGLPFGQVQVWNERPIRCRDSLGVYWGTILGAESLIGTYRLDWAKHYYRTVPDDDMQCIRNGE